MSVSKLDYAREYEVCERENITSTGRIQAGLHLFARNSAGPVWISDTLNVDAAALDTELQASASRTPVGTGHALVDTASFGVWLHHSHADTEIYEQPVLTSQTHAPSDAALDWDALLAQSRHNLFKFTQLLCQQMKAVTGAERVMVYRFHEDWSGEIIAEAVDLELDPYLGLHYPPTDIPKQARKLYEAVGTRHIFSTRIADTPLMALQENAAPLDLSLALGRGVSTYHIEYLRNMGTESTASCALFADGRLWGLISLHFSQSRPPYLNEFTLLQAVAEEASTQLQALLDDDRRQAEARLSRLHQRFMAELEAYSDPFRTLVLSDYSAHRIVNGHGMSLVLGRRIANVGKTPAPDVITALTERYGADLGELDSAYIDEFDDGVPYDGRRGIAGCAIVRLSQEPSAFLLVYRTEQNQTVTWGGDPRRHTALEDDRSFTPRRSFKTWVEQVAGRCAPWTELNRRALDGIVAVLPRHFEMSPRELTLLISNGLRQALKRRERVRDTAMDVIDGIQAAIAVGVEEPGNGDPKLIALNRTASDAFGITQAEATELRISELETLTGLDLSAGIEQSFTTTITTALQGVRECEVTIGVLFEAIDLDSGAKPFRVQVFEFRDVTEAKRIEAALQAARDRAIRDAQLRSEFFAQLGHELKTPLNGLIGLSELLVRFDRQALPEKVLKKITMIRDNSAHMADLVTATLENAAAVQYVDSSSFEAVNLRRVAADVAALLASEIEKKHVELAVEGDETLTGFSDPRGLRQVLINILGNAVKYNIEGGRVAVRIKPRDAAFVCIEVADTGPGMSTVQVERCMTPYTRFANGDGAGLGLSIANNLMAIMGGAITIRSTRGVGTNVELLVPAEAERFRVGVEERV